MSSTELPIAASAGGDGVVWLRGEHDAANAAQLSQVLAMATARNDADLVVDLSGVEFMGASTIGALVGARNALRSQSRQLVLRAPTKRAERLFHLCGLTAMIASPTSPPSALATWVAVPQTRPAALEQADSSSRADAELQQAVSDGG